MSILTKTASKSGFIIPKFYAIHVLCEDYLSLKSLFVHFRVPNCEIFKKNMKYFVGVRYDYCHENEDVHKNSRLDCRFRR
jgi:hypothetical protein